ncbi:MAG TPA: sulfite reductase subunit alpha [Verrucomicrobiae bacterium]|nr:sulfite reductase subunit alpha [Verrucomicrobiae bacterium]
MEAARKAASKYNRKNPFVTEIIHQEALTKPGSRKDTRHFVISLAGSGIQYSPGDSLGVLSRNPPELVERVVGLLGFDTPALRKALTQDYILNRANRKILVGLSERISQGEQRNRLMEILDNDEVCRDYLYTRDYIDILTEFEDARFESPEAFVSQLSPIPPRLYSIASSLAAHPDEVHLCVGVVRYEAHGRKRTGLATGFLADQTKLHVRDTPVYVQEARHFRLPQDGARDIIMIGPGTGVAPFRAFLEQRILDGARGRNWLFFGEQHRATDFLYGEEFMRWHDDGKLHRLDLAFSRDQPEKIYVQTRMQEHAREFWTWIQAGAYVYVCGDAKRMAKDVHQMLITIAREQGSMSPEAAETFISDTLMKAERRYLRDVY